MACLHEKIKQKQYKHFTVTNNQLISVRCEECKKEFRVWELNLFENPGKITVQMIDAETNAERRRLMVDLFGAVRYIQESGAKLLHEDRFGKLYRKDQPGDEPLVFVEVLNRTPEPDGTFKHYWLPVNPELRPIRNGRIVGEPQELTAWNAVASTFGLRGGQASKGFQVRQGDVLITSPGEQFYNPMIET